MPDTSGTHIYRYNRISGIIISVILASFSAAFIAVIFFGEFNPENRIAGIIFLLFLSYAFVGAFIASVHALVTGKPRLTISPEGIHLERRNEDIKYHWKDVGPFEAKIKKKQKYLFAYTEDTHNALVRSGHDSEPRIKNAEILLNVRSIPDLKTGSEIDTVADLINSYREKYGTPEQRYASNTEENQDVPDRAMQKLRDQEKINETLLNGSKIKKIIYPALFVGIAWGLLQYGAAIEAFFMSLVN